MPSRKTDKRVWFAAAALAADRISKALAADIAQPVDLGIVSLIPTIYNTGAAFSIGRGGKWVLIALTSAVLIAMLVYLRLNRRATALERIGLWLAFGGGLGNLIDRVFRPGVVDFINCNLFEFPVFNVGDICVCCGLAAAVIGMLAGERKGA